ncbi:uncharacterized protein LOC132169499 [Corylus avellana]|uniref:uncharacterized protein LOC132169499 n=1 Tax=Corylus avellana TaxID=13451 RepID=UPI00286C983E|nr:uncharacterized protein LOC132169499 [Corylus avellana]
MVETPLLDTIFSKEEVRLIQAIPISCTNQEDTLIWRGTKNGVFSVKSAYHMQKEVLSLALAGSSSSGVGGTLWKQFWSLPAPSVARNFLWRACNDILPTRENLCRRKILTDPLCPLCGLKVESGFHILWQCPSTMDLLSMGSKKFQKSYFLGPNFMQVIEGLFNKCDTEEMVQFSSLARRIWLRQNDIVYGGVLTHPRIVLQRTIKAIHEYTLAQQRGEQLVYPGGVPFELCWKAP